MDVTVHAANALRGILNDLTSTLDQQRSSASSRDLNPKRGLHVKLLCKSNVRALIIRVEANSACCTLDELKERTGPADFVFVT